MVILKIYKMEYETESSKLCIIFRFFLPFFSLEIAEQLICYWRNVPSSFWPLFPFAEKQKIMNHWYKIHEAQLVNNQ